jgi:hypothetical protein
MKTEIYINHLELEEFKKACKTLNVQILNIHSGNELQYKVEIEAEHLFTFFYLGETHRLLSNAKNGFVY